MNTQALPQQNVDNLELSRANLRIPDALKVALMRKISRLGGIHDELNQHGWAGIVTASELYLLEAEGFVVDFDSGLCVDTFAEVRS